MRAIIFHEFPYSQSAAFRAASKSLALDKRRLVRAAFRTVETLVIGSRSCFHVVLRCVFSNVFSKMLVWQCISSATAERGFLHIVTIERRTFRKNLDRCGGNFLESEDPEDSSSEDKCCVSMRNVFSCTAFNRQSLPLGNQANSDAAMEQSIEIVALSAEIVAISNCSRRSLEPFN